MKKRLISMILCGVLAIGMLSACGNSDSDDTNAKTEADEDAVEDAPSIDDIDVSEYIDEFPEYKGIKVTKTITPVTDTEMELEIHYALNQNPIDISDPEAKLEEGDTANIDYVGTLNGEAFDGGTAEDTDLVIGSGQFIDGFEDGLVGKRAGETVDLNLTFPEDYGNEELNGQEVVFTVTINAIKRPLSEPTDEWVSQISDYTTVEEYENSIREGLEAQYEEQAQTQMASDAWSQVIEAVEISSYPEELTEYGESILATQVESYAEASGQSVEEYIEAQDMSTEEYEEYKTNYGESYAKQILILKGIIDGEGFTTEDEDYQSTLQDYLDQYGMEEEEFYASYGKNSVYQSIMMQKAQQLVVDEADVEEVIADTENDEEVTEESGAEAAEETEEPAAEESETPAE